MQAEALCSAINTLLMRAYAGNVHYGLAANVAETCLSMSQQGRTAALHFLRECKHR